MPKYTMDDKGNIISLPSSEPLAEVEEQEQEPAPEAREKPDDGISDLFSVTDEDILGDIDERVEVDVEEDIVDGPLDDLTEVSNEDIMGAVPKQKPRFRIQPKGRRTIYRPPLSGMSGMR